MTFKTNDFIHITRTDPTIKDVPRDQGVNPSDADVLDRLEPRRLIKNQGISENDLEESLDPKVFEDSSDDFNTASKQFTGGHREKT